MHGFKVRLSRKRILAGLKPNFSARIFHSSPPKTKSSKVSYTKVENYGAFYSTKFRKFRSGGQWYGNFLTKFPEGGTGWDLVSETVSDSITLTQVTSQVFHPVFHFRFVLTLVVN